MEISENIVNIKKISDKHNLSLISPININLLFYELQFCGHRAVFPGVHI